MRNKMKIKYFLQLIILFLFVFFAHSAKCDNFEASEAEVWANGKGEEILEILADKDLNRKYLKLDEILYNDIDLDHAARYVVGRYWRTMTEEQKEKYVPLFKRYTAALYKAFPLDIKTGSIGFKIEKILPDKDFFDVFCSIKLSSSNNQTDSTGRINVIFSLTKKDSKIMVRDLKIAESSLLATYRERFYKMIHQDSDDEIDWFLEDLENLTQDKEAENQLKSEAFD